MLPCPTGGPVRSARASDSDAELFQTDSSLRDESGNQEDTGHANQEATGEFGITKMHPVVQDEAACQHQRANRNEAIHSVAVHTSSCGSAVAVATARAVLTHSSAG